MIRGQGIRPSQFVLTYGVGSVLEAPDGPRIIPHYRYWGRIFGFPDTPIQLSKFEIRDANVSALLKGGRIFRLPTNADMQIPDEQILFRTRRFPHWALCQEHRILYELTPSGTTRCPRCLPGRAAQDQAIRFVRACPMGHLDDVGWKSIVHRGKPSCDGTLFDWIERGSTLRDITIECRRCGAQATMQDVYNGTSACSGRFPESGIEELCDERARVILRNASNLRIPVIETALTVPPRTTPLHRLLENARILPILAAEPSWTKDKLLSRLRTAAQVISEINPVTISEIEGAPEDEILSAIEDVKKPLETDLTPKQVRDREFQALQSAAIHGAPPRPYPYPTDFEVDKDAVITTPLTPDMTLRVTPVKRLRVVMAQKGYRRLIRGRSPPRVVETLYSVDRNPWYVGVVVHGEGIFIDLPPKENLDSHLPQTAKAWWDEFERKKSYLFHPVFVWWHTLSHRFIDALAIDSGYSSASIRERAYITAVGDEPSRGGVLLYTSQRGGDGSLGGLIAMVPEFGKVVSAALRNIDSCSNDPLCAEQEFVSGRINGSSCYACLFLSETSCEFGNSYLDRNLLRRTI